jgi:hypothetical protein
MPPATGSDETHLELKDPTREDLNQYLKAHLLPSWSSTKAKPLKWHNHSTKLFIGFKQ